MGLLLTIVIALGLIVPGLVGYIRNPRRGVVALLGTLVGAVLVDLWARQWGAALAGRFVVGDAQRLTFAVSCAVFLWSALVVGYGGGLLVGRAKELVFSQRLAGLLLGLLNGVLLVGFLLRFATTTRPDLAAAIQAAPAARIIHDGLPLLFLGGAVAVTLLVLVRGVTRLFSRRAAPAKQKGEAKQPASGQPAASQSAPGRVDNRGVLDKINRQM